MHGGKREISCLHSEVHCWARKTRDSYVDRWTRQGQMSKFCSLLFGARWNMNHAGGDGRGKIDRRCASLFDFGGPEPISLIKFIHANEMRYKSRRRIQKYEWISRWNDILDTYRMQTLLTDSENFRSRRIQISSQGWRANIPIDFLFLSTMFKAMWIVLSGQKLNFSECFFRRG